MGGMGPWLCMPSCSSSSPCPSSPSPCLPSHLQFLDAKMTCPCGGGGGGIHPTPPPLPPPSPHHQLLDVDMGLVLLWALAHIKTNQGTGVSNSCCRIMRPVSLGKPSWKKSSLSVDIVCTCPNPPPHDYGHQWCTFFSSFIHSW